MRRELRTRALVFAAWAGIATLVTLALWLAREQVVVAQTALAFLVVVLVGSARGGRAVGVFLAIFCFLVFNFFLLPPYYTFHLSEALDWWVLAAFLVTAGVAAQLLHRQQVAALEAQQRAREIDRLSALGAESLAVPRAGDAVHAIERVIQAELPVARASIHPVAEGADRATPVDAAEARVARSGRSIGVTGDGQMHEIPEATSLATLLTNAGLYTEVLVPLRVRERMLAVLRISDPGGLHFEAGQARFADALAYYAALAAERARLSAETEHIEALREADRLKDALLASVSHDLRTPLTSIKALAAELRTTGDERGALMEEEADRLNRFVTDLLDLSRLSAGALPLSPELIAAEDLVGAALQRLAGVPGATAVRVSLPADGSLPLGRFDFVHSLRALTNLIDNALRFSPEPGSVELGVRIEGAFLVLEVSDRGPGVDEAERGRLFEPFAAARDAGGTGLGLSIASRIAEAQAGSVRYEPRPGGGSTFSLRLPAASLAADG